MNTAEARELIKRYSVHEHGYRCQFYETMFATKPCALFPDESEPPLTDYDEAVAIGRDLCTASEGRFTSLHIIDVATDQPVIRKPLPLESAFAKEVLARATE